MYAENPYRWGTEKLLNELMIACGRVGVSNSGLVISLAGGDDLSNVYYLRGVVEARIDQVMPPFHQSDRVKAKKNPLAPLRDNRGYHHERELVGIFTVSKVFYYGEGRWEINFRETTEATARLDHEYGEDGSRSRYVPLGFRAEDFELHVPLEGIHRAILNIYAAYSFKREAPTHLSCWLNLPLEDTLAALRFLAEAGYLKEIDPWFHIKHEEDKHCYELVTQ